MRHARYARILGLVAFSCFLGAQTQRPYRIIGGQKTRYTVRVEGGKLAIQPSAAPAVLMSIISSETTALTHAPAGEPGGSAILRFSSLSNPRNERVLRLSATTDYLGAFGSVFALNTGSQTLAIEYPKTGMSLFLKVSLSNGIIRLDEAHYAGVGDLSSLSTKYLKNWLTKIPSDIAVTPGSCLELDVPHPSSKAALAPGEREYFTSSSASTAIGAHKYYQLTVISIPPGARVYIGGEFVGLAGANIKAESPARVLVRYPGYVDVAENVELGDGPNEITITLARGTR